MSNNTSSSWGQFVQRALAQKPRDPVPVRASKNPRPPGVIRHGSATHSVLELLQQHPDRYFDHRTIVFKTGCTGKSVDWACIYLRSQGLVESAADQRNPRYARYRLAKDKDATAKVSIGIQRAEASSSLTSGNLDGSGS